MSNSKNTKKKNHTEYFKDGGIRAKGTFKNGKLDGYWLWFRKDGTKLRSGYFINNKQTGKWTTYDQKGKVYKITDFDKLNKKIKPSAKKS